MIIPRLENKKDLINKAVDYYLEIRDEKTDNIINNIYKKNYNVYNAIKYYQNNPNLIILECMLRYLIKYIEYIKLIPAAPGKYTFIDIQKQDKKV